MADDLLVQEIYELVQTFNKHYQDLFIRMDEDFKLWTLNEYKLDEFSDNVTFNEPRVFADAVMQIIETAKMNIVIKRRDGNEELESKIERFLIACFEEINEKLLGRGMPALNSFSTWTACIRGMVAARFLYRNNRPEALPYDPRWLAYEMDSTGPCWSGYQTWRTPYALMQEYDKKFKALEGKKKHETIKVTDFWGKARNMVLVGDSLENVEPASEGRHSLGKPPVVIIPIGSAPLITTTEDNYTYVKHWVESIYAGGRPIYENLSKILSIWMSVARKSREPSGFITTPDGQMKIEYSPYGRSQWTTLPEGSQVQPLEPPDIANSIPQLFEILSQAAQRSDFVWARYSLLTGSRDISNVLFENMKATADRVLVPILRGLERFYKQASRLLIEQYIATGGPIEVEGIDYRNNEFREEVSPEEIDGDYSIDIKFVSVTPEEEAANIARAQMLKSSELAPDSFIRRDVIKFADPVGVEDAKRVEDAEKLSPTIRLKRVAASLGKQGRADEAQDIINELNKLQAMEQQALQQPMSPQPPQGA